MKHKPLEKLYETLMDRKDANPKESYVASLYKKGARKIAKKLGEEATELVIESIRLEDKPKSAKRQSAFKEEGADLLFHFLMLMAHHNIHPNEVIDVLEARMGISGLEEKASRKKEID